MKEQTSSSGDNPTRQSIPRSPWMMSASTSALLVVDVQQKLVPLISGHQRLVWNARRLIDGAQILGVSTLCTEQYPQGLGNTVEVLAGRLSVDDQKTLFSCRHCRNVMSRLKGENRHQVLLCGIETHVCIQQTALDLVSMGLDVWVAVDAVGSRFPIDHDIALQRMEQSGVTLTTTESALFEWCEIAGTSQFKRISQLVREQAPPE